MCECVNIQYKRLEQLSGANPQTQPRVSDFIWQLAASEDSSRTTGEAERSGALALRLTARLSLRLSDTGGRQVPPPPDRTRPSSVPPQLALLISFLMYHRYVSVNRSETLGTETDDKYRSPAFQEPCVSLAKPYTQVLFASLDSLSVKSYFSSQNYLSH